MLSTYEETLDFLFSQLPMFQREGKSALKKDLGNIIKLCHFLGHPHRRIDTIHIAGTNGKGSVSHMLAAILQASGLKVGLYTSPHYLDFRERIKINEEYISEEEVVAFVKQIKPCIAALRPSFFEISVAMAFDCFCRRGVDIAVMETGLGGPLDSTNILLPLLSVITNISLDHQDFLGETLPEIAGEKAGIIKPHIPVLVGIGNQSTDQVFIQKASECQSPLYFAESQCQVEGKSIGFAATELLIKWSENGGDPMAVLLDAGGPYQVENAKTVIAAISVLNRHTYLNITRVEIKIGLENLKNLTAFIGRWQLLRENPTVLVDSGHNRAGIQAAMIGLEQLNYRQLHILLGVVKSKSLDCILPLMPKSAIYYYCAAHLPRALDAGSLAAEAGVYGLEGQVYESVDLALTEALHQAHPTDLIFVGGSTFVVAETLSFNMLIDKP